MIHGLLIAIGHHLWPVLLGLQLTFSALSLLASQVNTPQSPYPQYIAAFASLITALSVWWTARSNGRKIDTAQELSLHNTAKIEAVQKKVDAVHAEQATDNGLNLGGTVAAILSQGIAAKLPENRTDTDLKHQQDMADNDPSGVVAADQAAAALREASSEPSVVATDQDSRGGGEGGAAAAEHQG